MSLGVTQLVTVPHINNLIGHFSAHLHIEQRDDVLLSRLIIALYDMPSLIEIAKK